MKYRSDPPGNGDSNSSTNSTTTASMGGAAAAPPRHKSKSGIFDISHTADLKSPVELFGYSASTSTKERARRNAASAGFKADLFRMFLVAIVVPIVATAAYVQVTGRSLQLGAFAPLAPLHQRTANSTVKAVRQPASALPTVQPIATAANQVEPAKTILVSPSHVPRAFALTLDSNGQLVTPFALELDENGLEIARVDAEARRALMPPILSDEFRQLSSIKKLTVPTTFNGMPNGHPFIYSASERNRLAQLRESAPEIKKMLTFASSSTAERLRVSPLAAASLRPPRLKTTPAERTYADAIRELTWVQKATLTANVSGDSLIEKRISETLLTWAKTYQPSGDALIDRPLFDLLHGYDFVRANIDAENRKTLDDFFRDVVDRQFSRARSMKEYDLEHATHTLFAVTVGLITEDVGLQYYSTSQYQAHLQHTPLLNESTFGPAQVEILRTLLQTAFILERSGSTAHKSETLNRLVTTMIDGSQDDPVALLNVMGAAAYFRPELYPRIAKLAAGISIVSSRFGTANTALLAALRKPNSSLLADAPAPRAPSGRAANQPAPRSTNKARR